MTTISDATTSPMTTPDNMTTTTNNDAGRLFSLFPALVRGDVGNLRPSCDPEVRGPSRDPEFRGQRSKELEMRSAEKDTNVEAINRGGVGEDVGVDLDCVVGIDRDPLNSISIVPEASELFPELRPRRRRRKAAVPAGQLAKLRGLVLRSRFSRMRTSLRTSRS